MKKIFSLFKIQKEERLLVLFFLVVLVALNGLVINLYYDKFTPFTRFYWPLFIRNFHVSGFDPITYSIMTGGRAITYIVTPCWPSLCIRSTCLTSC